MGRHPALFPVGCCASSRKYQASVLAFITGLRSLDDGARPKVELRNPPQGVAGERQRAVEPAEVLLLFDLSQVLGAEPADGHIAAQCDGMDHEPIRSHHGNQALGGVVGDVEAAS